VEIDGPFDAYVRGYFDALDTIERFRDLPVDAVVATAREHIATRFPAEVQRVVAERISTNLGKGN
jgi:hypothetical protein